MAYFTRGPPRNPSFVAASSAAIVTSGTRFSCATSSPTPNPCCSSTTREQPSTGCFVSSPRSCRLTALRLLPRCSNDLACSGTGRSAEQTPMVGLLAARLLTRIANRQIPTGSVFRLFHELSTRTLQVRVLDAVAAESQPGEKSSRLRIAWTRRLRRTRENTAFAPIAQLDRAADF